MNTFLKVLIVLVAVVVAFKLLPVLMLPVVLGAVGLLLFAVLLIGGVAAMAGVGLAGITAILAVGLVVLTALSPVWVPVLVIVGLIALIRHGTRAKT